MGDKSQRPLNKWERLSIPAGAVFLAIGTGFTLQLLILTTNPELFLLSLFAYAITATFWVVAAGFLIKKITGEGSVWTLLEESLKFWNL